jgi:hypothetical protein
MTAQCGLHRGTLGIRLDDSPKAVQGSSSISRRWSIFDDSSGTLVESACKFRGVANTRLPFAALRAITGPQPAFPEAHRVMFGLAMTRGSRTRAGSTFATGLSIHPTDTAF